METIINFIKRQKIPVFIIGVAIELIESWKQLSTLSKDKKSLYLL